VSEGCRTTGAGAKAAIPATLTFTRRLPSSANRDFIALFTNGASAHVLKYFYLYPDDNDTNLLPQQHRYYVFNEDVRLIHELLKAQAANTIDFTVPTTLVDLGPGEVNAFLLKVKPILDMSPETKSYIAIDYSPQVLAELRDALQSLENRHLLTFVCGDFQSAQPCRLSVQNSTVLLLGQTIGSLPVYRQGSFPDHELVEFLQNMQECFPRTTQFVLTLDRCLDWNAVLSCYSGELTYNFFRRGYRNLFHGRDTCPAEVFTTEIRVDPEASCICFDLRLTKDVTIDFWDRSITVARDRRFTLGTSYRFSLEKAVSLLRRAGFPSIQQLEFPDSHVALLLARQ
jgi:uncharacterized SAM-dependent methyltransferase